jgi:predicted DNA-binding transcriptional regulator AlpA
MDHSVFMLNIIEQHLVQLHLLQKEVLTFKEGCSFCGFSTSWMYKLTGKKKIPHYKPNGKMIFFRRSELEIWLLSNHVAAIGKVQNLTSSSNKKRRDRS